MSDSMAAVSRKDSMRQAVHAALDGLRDSSDLPHSCPAPSLLSLAWQTLRYRAASRGCPLTPNERRLAGYRDRHRGQRAFILGNGPSLNRCDLRLLKDEITFGVNSIFLNYDKMGFHPNYYVVEDVLVAEDRSEQINAYRGPVKFFGNYLSYCISPNPDAIWLNVRFRYDDYPDFPHFSRDALRMVWVGGTVTYLCLQLAYYMGFSEVYLVGFDHAYQIPKDAVIDGTRITSVSDDPNHFDAGYFGSGYRWHDPRLDRMEQAYAKAKTEFEADGRKIYNATSAGNLEIFPRVDYASLF